MGVENNQAGKITAAQSDLAHLFKPLSTALLNLDEAERFRMLSSFLSDLAEMSRNATDGRGAPSQGRLDAVARQAQSLAKEKASLEDALRTTEADLAVARKQLEAERGRASELQKVMDDQRSRLKSAQEELEQLQAEVVARNADVHKLEAALEKQQIKAQRAELAMTDSSRVEGLEESKRELIGQIETLRGQFEQLRADKDAQIERVKEELSQTKRAAGGGADALLSDLWQRLASAKPPLVEGHIKPNKQAAERLVDAFVELVRFVDDFDKSMRVFLGRYCKYDPSVKVPWEAYAKGEDLYEFARRTVAPTGGRPVGPLKMRLRLLYSWTYAGMVGCDAAIESLGKELMEHLIGPQGAGNDPNRKIRDYLRDDGHLLFMQHVLERRSKMLAETYGRG